MIHETARNALYGFVIEWLDKQRPPRGEPFCDYERIKRELQPCDVILIEGRSRVSRIISTLTQSPWTHAALYLGCIEDMKDRRMRNLVRGHYRGSSSDQLVIESLLGYGTIIRNLDVYEREHLRICRPSRLDGKDGGQVLNYALTRLTYEYDVRQILDLARFLFPLTIAPRRWRSSLFNQADNITSRTVCSTMIAEAFATVQFPILPLIKRKAEGEVRMYRMNPRLCTPRDFDHSPYFEIIKYPFVDFSFAEDYRFLPWEDDGELTPDEAEIYLVSSTPARPEMKAASGPTTPGRRPRRPFNGTPSTT